LFFVEKSEYKGPVKIGIGTRRQERALFKAGCEKVFFPNELVQLLDERKLSADIIFRPEDTIVMMQPGLLKPEWFREFLTARSLWQVPGNDAMKLKTEDDRAAWKKQKPKGVRARIERDRMGRPPKWPIPTTEQVAAILAIWHSGKKPGPLLDQVRGIVGADVPDHWVRDQVIKAKGNARRTEE